jgi:hypothetical protein
MYLKVNIPSKLHGICKSLVLNSFHGNVVENLFVFSDSTEDNFVIEIVRPETCEVLLDLNPNEYSFDKFITEITETLDSLKKFDFILSVSDTHFLGSYDPESFFISSLCFESFFICMNSGIVYDISEIQNLRRCGCGSYRHRNTTCDCGCMAIYTRPNTPAIEPTVQSQISCKICWDKDVNWSANCGHCYCEDCKDLVSSCGFCRKPIESWNKIFL